MSSAYNMHADWRPMEPRRMLEMAKRHGARITPYTRGIGQRSYIVSWATEWAPDCEGNLYVLRVRAKKPKCDDCDEPIDPKTDKFFRLSDPWGRLTGDCVCERCREKRWDSHQERLMEGA